MIDTDFLERQLTYAGEDAAKARATVANASVGEDHLWKLDGLVGAETRVRLYTVAVNRGVEVAADTAWSFIADSLDSSSTNPYVNAVARSRAAMAYNVIRFLASAGLTHERLGQIVAGRERS